MNTRDPLVWLIVAVLATILVLHLAKFVLFSVSWPALAVILLVAVVLLVR
jgi:hypothetical protein